LGGTTSFETTSAARFELGAGARKKKDKTAKKKTQKGYASPICGDAPVEAIYIKNCVVQVTSST